MSSEPNESSTPSGVPGEPLKTNPKGHLKLLLGLGVPLLLLIIYEGFLRGAN